MASKRPKKLKKVSYERIDPMSEVGAPIYAMLDDVVRNWHQDDLGRARLMLAWNTAWKPDVDGIRTLGKMKKATDLDRELANFDGVILLSRWFWYLDEVTDKDRIALLDHECRHLRLKLDDNGLPVQDERDHLVYRIAKHDIEEFTEIVQRHGIWKSNLEAFAAALLKAGVPKFDPCEACLDSPGWVMVPDPEHGSLRAQRCVCYQRWRQRALDFRAAGVAG